MQDNPNMYSIQRKKFLNNSTYIFELYYDDSNADDIESDSLINLLYSPFVDTIREVKWRSNKYFYDIKLHLWPQIKNSTYDGVCVWKYSIYRDTAEDSIDPTSLVKIGTEEKECYFRNETSGASVGCIINSAVYTEPGPIITKTQYGLIVGSTLGACALIVIIVVVVWRRKFRRIQAQQKEIHHLDRANQNRMTEVNPDLNSSSEDERYDNEWPEKNLIKIFKINCLSILDFARHTVTKSAKTRSIYCSRRVQTCV